MYSNGRQGNTPHMWEGLLIHGKCVVNASMNVRTSLRCDGDELCHTKVLLVVTVVSSSLAMATAGTPAN
jgi:hypothetical protein